MDSRLLASLNAQAGSTNDPVVWAKAVCRAASHYAAHGKTDEALVAIRNVRNQFGRDLHIDIASWLMLAEGVLHYFHARVPDAYDRIRRAYGLAIALRNNSAFPSCAAWMAHIEYESCRYEEMTKHLEESLLTAHEKDYQAVSRASLTLAVSYHIAGDFEKARPWYEKARLSAAAEGDDATVSATLHNMASFRAANVRLEDTFGGNAKKETERVSLEASSSETYDYAIGHKGLDFLSLMLRGLIFTIDGKYSDALRTIELIELDAVPDRLRPLVIVDKVWCEIKSGNQKIEWPSIQKLTSSLMLIKEDDDLAYAYSRMRQIALACGEYTSAKEFERIAEAALTRHRIFQADLIQKLDRIDRGSFIE